MKKVAFKVAVITLAVGALFGMQQYSGKVFGQNVAGSLMEEKRAVDQALTIELKNMPDNSLLKTYVDVILQEENQYKQHAESCWLNTEKQFTQLPGIERDLQHHSEYELALRNQLLRESHVMDAKMLPHYKDLRKQLEVLHLGTGLANTLEKHFEVTKKCLLLYEMP